MHAAARARHKAVSTPSADLAEELLLCSVEDADQRQVAHGDAEPLGCGTHRHMDGVEAEGARALWQHDAGQCRPAVPVLADIRYP
ncbi:MAG TPA: hypothetical protein VM639_03685 [Dongiaceae bacterium]|nr:hypothetical protein [Dongiaceae bacterium]